MNCGSARRSHESLEQQTATSEVLASSARSPGELEPVFQAMLQNAVRICDAKFGILFLHESEIFAPGRNACWAARLCRISTGRRAAH